MSPLAAPPAASPEVRPQREVGPAPSFGPPLPLGFTVDADHQAHEPPEARGTARDGVRLMVSAGRDVPLHTTFDHLPDVLGPGDLVVVNTSATVAAALDVVAPRASASASAEVEEGFVLHVSTELPGGLWMVEPRRPVPGGATRPLSLDPAARTLRVVGRSGEAFHLLRPAAGSDRLWLAAPADGVDVLALLAGYGRPIRYGYVERAWPLEDYQTVFASEPGSAEMPSASRPFTDRVVSRLIARGVAIATVTLHTGVSSLEGHELPYAERYRVPATTAATINAVHSAGGRVIAAGTTVVRAVETVADRTGVVHPGAGWTDTVITPARGVRAVDGLLTGWHEPEATHLAMLEAVAGREALVIAYREAFAHGYLWHEFGDSHLLLPYAHQP